jgi:glycine cleavage system H lipoate-binding protein
MSQKPDPRFPIVPPGQLKCVWMSAGLLAYQLCDRGLDCEHCPLDAALRTHFRRQDPIGSEPAPGREPTPLAGDRCYSGNHCWVQPVEGLPEGSGRCRIGIEPGLAAALPMLHAVVLPRVGESIQRGRAHLWVVVEGGTFPLAAPADGVVKEVNRRLIERPSLIAVSPLEEGWLYEIEALHADAQLASLMPTSAAERSFATDARRFQAELTRSLNREAAALGPTLPDGGAPLPDLAQMLGAARYFELLCRVYG